MKKIIGIFMTLIGLVVACLGLIFKFKSNNGTASTVIIGGADGPTSVFVAGKVGNGSTIMLMALGLLFLIIGVVLIALKHKES